MMKDRINEIVIVEGKDDTKRLKRLFDVDTIETGGDALDEQKIRQIRTAVQKREIIIFTDPDFSGEKIRRTLTEVFPNAKHAFITKEEGAPTKKGSLGVEHASDEAIIQALKNVMTTSPTTVAEIPQSTLIKEGLIVGQKAKWYRAQLGEKLRIGYTNGKQLQKRLRMFCITEDELKQTMNEIREEER